MRSLLAISFCPEYLHEGYRSSFCEYYYIHFQHDQINKVNFISGWLIGSGLRETIQIFFAFCIVIWLFFRTKTGVAIMAGGINPKFAGASGINIDKKRIIANIISTVLAALGIILYSQSYGYVQLYTAPLNMAFPAVAAILIGGATASRASVTNVIIGVFLFQGLLTTSLPVANQLFTGTDLSEIMRMKIFVRSTADKTQMQKLLKALRHIAVRLLDCSNSNILT